MSFKSDQLKVFGIEECREVDDPENRACEISLARLSPRLLRRRESKRHLFVVDSLDKQMQNEKELIRLASAGVGGLFCICVGSINLTWQMTSQELGATLMKFMLEHAAE